MAASLKGKLFKELLALIKDKKTSAKDRRYYIELASTLRPTQGEAKRNTPKEAPPVAEVGKKETSLLD